jgi:hypothetical protein
MELAMQFVEAKVVGDVSRGLHLQDDVRNWFGQVGIWSQIDGQQRSK